MFLWSWKLQEKLRSSERTREKRRTLVTLGAVLNLFHWNLRIILDTHLRSHKSNLNFQNGGSSTSQGKTWIRLEEDKQIDLKSYSVSPTWESQKERNKSNSLYSPSVSYHRRGDTSDISVPILDHLVNQLRSQQIKGHRVDPSANQMQV